MLDGIALQLAGPEPEDEAAEPQPDETEEVSKVLKSGSTPSRRLPDWLRLESVVVCEH